MIPDSTPGSSIFGKLRRDRYNTRDVTCHSGHRTSCQSCQWSISKKGNHASFLLTHTFRYPEDNFPI